VTALAPSAAPHAGAVPSSAVVVSPAAVRLAWVVAVLAVFASGVGLMWTGGVAPETATTIRGETVELYGTGLYRYDSLHVGPVFRGTDVVVLTLILPLLALATVRYRRGSTRGALLLAATLLWLLYLYLSLAVGAAYNELFLVYIALVATSSSALALTLRSIDTELLAHQVHPSLPRRGISTFLLVTTVGTLVLWGGLALAALAAGRPPAHLQLATTTVEEALSLGLLVPAFVFTALTLRGGNLGIGVKLGFPLLVLVAGLAPVITAQTAAQLLAGVTLTLGEVIGLVATWMVLGVIASAFVARIWRSVDETDARSSWGTGGHLGSA
jgi:hypothetical protein